VQPITRARVRAIFQDDLLATGEMQCIRSRTASHTTVRGTLTAAPVVSIIRPAVVGCIVRQSRGVAAMVRNVVAGCVLAALIFMVLLAFAQKHDEFCMHGHLIKTFRPCGSVSSSL
jgi:hypothetical protein